MIKFGKKISCEEALFQSLVEKLSLRSMVKVMYLFGSRAADRADELSDIDIALLVEGGRMPLDVELDLLGEITSILQTDEVSLVVLNNAPLTVAHGVIKEARVLYSSNEQERLDFEELVTRKYFDFKHYLDIYDREFMSVVGR